MALAHKLQSQLAAKLFHPAEGRVERGGKKGNIHLKHFHYWVKASMNKQESAIAETLRRQLAPAIFLAATRSQISTRTAARL